MEIVNQQDHRSLILEHDFADSEDYCSINVPEELKNYDQWVCWKIEVKKDKLTKVPINVITGENAKPNNPKTWASFNQALDYFKKHQSHGIAGIGFVFSAEDSFTGIDLDKCSNPETEEIESWAIDIIREMDSYTEISPSGKGVHILVKGKLPPNGRKNGKIEMYDSGRFFTVTGEHLKESPLIIKDRDSELKALHQRTFPPPVKSVANTKDHTSSSMTDAEIINKASQAANGSKFSRLWQGNWQSCYPSQCDYPSHSEADSALCFMLAFWTQDFTQIDRLFRQSKLMRDKWDSPRAGSTYGANCVKNAINHVISSGEIYQREADETAEGGSQGSGISYDQESKPEGEKQQKKADLIIANFNRTDLGNAERLVARHGKDMRYCHIWERWLTWDGRRWVQDNSGEIDRRAIDTVRHIYVESGQSEDKNFRKELASYALVCESEARRRAMINSSRALEGIPIQPEELDQEPWLLNVANGTLELRSGSLREHRREDLITKVAPVNYDPKATCPIWENFLDRIMDGNQNLILYLQKAAGYALTGSTKEQCLFFLYGLGANGKSTFLNIIREMMGDYAKQTTSETFMVKKGDHISCDIADLKGARFVAAAEVENGRRLAEVMVKQITGGDRVKARFLYAQLFEYDPEYKIFLAANHKPVIRGTDNAIWRRIRLIPFTVQIPEPEQDKELMDKLRVELPGILNWSISGCLQWQYGKLNPPQEVKNATNDYRLDMDILNDFFEDRCIIEEGVSVKVGELYKAYTDWAEKAGEKKLLSSSDFGSKMEERGFPVNRKGKGGSRFRVGLRLKTSFED